MFCYILYNDTNKKTYNGFTTDLLRRIRQHNNEIKGGARYTTMNVVRHDIVWSYLCIVESKDFTFRNALSLEWHIKHPTGSRVRPKEYQGPHGRIESLRAALEKNQFKGMKFKVHADPFFFDTVVTALSHIDDVEVVSL